MEVSKYRKEQTEHRDKINKNKTNKKTTRKNRKEVKKKYKESPNDFIPFASVMGKYSLWQYFFFKNLVSLRRIRVNGSFLWGRIKGRGKGG